MPSLNLDLDILQNPKVKKLRRTKLGPLAEVYVIRLWIHAAKFYVADGVFTNQSAEDLESEADWRGKTRVMVDAMVSTGWLERVGSDFAIHDWSEHQGHLSAYKVRSQKANKSRWDKARQQQSPADEADPSSIHDGVLEDDPRNPPAAPAMHCITSNAIPAAPAMQVDPPGHAAAEDEIEEKRKRRAELSHAGISGKNLTQLSEVEDLHPADVLAAVLAVKKKSDLRNPIGWIVDELREVPSRSGRTIDLQTAVTMINSGAVGSINGFEINGPAGFSSRGLHVQTSAGEKVAQPSYLTPDVFGLKPINERIPRPAKPKAVDV
jgi:hypothetical protein